MFKIPFFVTTPVASQLRAPERPALAGTGATTPTPAPALPTAAIPFGRRAEAGFNQPQPAAPATSSPATAAPLSGRVIQPPGQSPPGWRQRFKQRQIVLSSKVLGAGFSRSQEQPQVVFVPAAHPASLASLAAPVTAPDSALPAAGGAVEVSDSELIAAADALTARMTRLLDTSLEQLADVNQRPGRSAAMEQVTSIWPLTLLKSKKIKDLIQLDAAYAVTGSTAALAPAAGKLTPVARQGVLDEVASAFDALIHAERAFKAALARAAAQPGRPTSVAASREALDRAIKTLHAVLSLNTRLGANDNALAADILRRKMAFVQQQTAHCAERLRAASEGSAEQMAALDQQASNLHQAVKCAMSANRHALLTLEERVVEAGRLRAQAAAAVGLALGPTIDRDSLTLQMASLRRQIPSLRQEVAVAEQQLATAWQALDQLMPPYAQQRQQASERKLRLDGAARRLDAVSQPIAAKVDHWTAEAKAAAQHQQQTHDQAISALLASPPGFDAQQLGSLHAGQLKRQLQAMVERLPDDDPQAERSMPRVAQLEILSRGLARAAGGQAEAAVALLAPLLALPSEHWCPLPGQPAPAMPPALRQLFRSMAQVPRGIELLHQISAHGGATMSTSQREALQTYWVADQAQASERDPTVLAWLDQAKAGASHVMRHDKKNPAGHDLAALPRAERVAFGAVSRGMLSNGPGSDYQRIDRSLQQVGDDWIEAAKEERGKLRRALCQPGKGRTPFDPRTLRLASKQLEAQGMPSVKSEAHHAVAKAASALSAKLAAGGLRGSAGETDSSAEGMAALRFDVTAQVVCDYIARQQDGASAAVPLATAAGRTAFERSKRLYQGQLGARDLELIRREVTARLDRMADQPAGGHGHEHGHKLGHKHGNQRQAGLRARLIKPDLAAPPLPELFESLLRRPALGAIEALEAIAGHLDRELDEASKERLGMARLRQDIGLDRVGHQVEVAQRKRFDSKQQVLDFFAPMLKELRLRNQLTMTSGGEWGITIPVLPWAPITPFMANVTLNVFSRKREASFQVKSPTYGVEFIIGETSTDSHDAKLMGGVGLDLGPFKLSLPSILLKADISRASTDYTVLRVLRSKDKSGVREEQVARDDSFALLDTLLRWDSKHLDEDVQGAPYASVLEAILDLHPEVVIGAGHKENRNYALGADVAMAARAPFAGGHLNGGIGITPLGVKAEVAKEHGTERSGFAHQGTDDRSDQRKQRAAATVALGGLVTAVRERVDPADAGQGSWRMLGGINLLDMSRELVFNIEKNGATRFSMGDKTGGSVDRVYGTPQDLLAEIEQNQEDFFLRFLETIPLEEGAEADTPANRALAATALQQFMDDLRHSKKNANLQYNIKYELQPRISGWVDALNALETLALAAGDVAAAQEHRVARAQLMSFRSSWSFKNCAIRSKGKDSDDVGLDFVVRLLAKRSAETSMAVSAYPA